MGWTLGRRAFLTGIAATALPLGRVRAQSESIRLGLLCAKTGPLAEGGIQMEQGLTTFLKQKNFTLAGRKIDLIVADTAGNPANAKTKAQELVERNRIDVMAGPLAAFEALAISDYMTQAGVPELSLAAAEDLTQRKPSPWFVRPSGTSSQSAHATAHYLATEVKAKRLALIAEDFAFGHEQLAGFQHVFEDNGGKVIAKLWPPLSATDYAPYIAQIAQLKNLDGVFMGFAAVNGIRFLRQCKEYGLIGKIRIYAGHAAMDDANTRAFGEETVGVISGEMYALSLDSPMNKQFIADMAKNYDAVPGHYSLSTYLDGQFIEAALQAIGGRIDDRQAFMKAVRAVRLADSPSGPVRLDEYGNSVRNVFIRRTERVGGKITNVIIKTYPEVSQFWTYDPKSFLAQPVYSRDYPPAKNLEI